MAGMIRKRKRQRIPTEGSRAFRRAIREGRLTLEDVAEILSTERVTVWRWIHGLCVPSHASLCLIEDRFEVDHRLWLQRCTRVHDR